MTDTANTITSTADAGATDAGAALAGLLRDIVDTGITPGVVAEITWQGDPTITAVAGRLASHGADGLPIPAGSDEPVTPETLYDLASLTKIFSSITVLSLVDDGLLDLGVPVSTWLPEYTEGRKSEVTLAHFLSHTSGLPGVWPDSWHDQVEGDGTPNARWVQPDRDTIVQGVLDVELVNDPGTTKEYSCLGYISAMAIAERVTGTPWEQLVTERVLAPLGLHGVTFAPDPARTAPTEFQPELGRGMVRGVVHDENAYALGGRSGNAGLFAPVRDLTTLGLAILDGLPDVLSPESAALLWDDRLPVMLGDRAAAVEERIGYGQSLGLRIGQLNWMGENGLDARGHTGFTGTSLQIDRAAGLVIVILANRVHPSRDLSDAAGMRRAVSALAYRLVAHG